MPTEDCIKKDQSRYSLSFIAGNKQLCYSYAYLGSSYHMEDLCIDGIADLQTVRILGHHGSHRY